MDGYFNPYMNPYLNPYQYQAQKHEQNVVRVSGYEGAKNYAMELARFPLYLGTLI